MKKNMLARVLLLVFAILMLQTVAYADIVVTKYDHNAYFNSPFQTTRACGCGFTTDYFTLENTGDFDAYFNLNLESNANWIELNRYQVFLEAGEHTLVPVSLAPPCNTDEAVEYTVYASSMFGRYRAAERTVTATTCEALRFRLEQLDDNIKPCTEANFLLHVTNVATYRENYHIAAEDDRHVSLAQSYITLEPGQTQTIPARALWACDVSGAQKVPFTVTAEKTQTGDTKTGIVNIMEDYEFTVDFPGRYHNICAEIGHTQDIVVTNIASTPNTYFIDVSGSSWANLEEDEFDLLPGHSKTVTMTYNPAESAVGAGNVAIAITSQSNSDTKYYNLEYNVEDCFEHELILIPQEATFCAGIETVTVQVQNRGQFIEDFTVSSSGDLFSEFATSQVTLRPGEHANLPLEIGIPDRNAEFQVDVHVTQTPGISSTQTLDITTVTNADCTELNPTSTELDVYRDAQIVPFIVEHRGIEASNYALTWEGKAFELIEQEVFIAPGEQVVLHLRAKNLTELPAGEYTEKFHMTSHRAIYRDDFKVNLKDKSWLTRLYERIAYGSEGRIDWCLLILVILIIVLIALLIILALIGFGSSTYEHPSWITESRGIIMAILAILAVICLIVAIVMAVRVSLPSSFEEPFVGSDYSELYHEVGENQVYRLDLDRYFFDPDGEQLSYSDNQPAYLDIRYEGDTAVIVPHRGFSGEDLVVFTATDSQGSAIDSPVMTMKVVKKTPVTFWQWINSYCCALHWFILAIIFALLLLGVWAFRNHRKNDDKVDENAVTVYEGRTVTAQPVGGQLVPAQGSQKNVMVKGDVVAGDKVTVINDRDRTLVASQNGKKAHRTTCALISRLDKKSRKTFKSPEEAITAGYSECKMCRSFE